METIAGQLEEGGTAPGEEELEELDIEAHSVTQARAPRARRYTIRVDDERVRISTATPKGRVILEAVGKCAESYFLEQRMRGGGGQDVGPDDVVDLRAPGVERFATFFKLSIEGKVYRWSEPIITPEQIAQLGGWNIGEGVVVVDQDQNETQLNPGQVVTLAAGCSFGKKLRWKRG
jgi:hypothetical protein